MHRALIEMPMGSVGCYMEGMWEAAADTQSLFYSCALSLFSFTRKVKAFEFWLVSTCFYTKFV